MTQKHVRSHQTRRSKVPPTDWLGFPSPLERPVRRSAVTRHLAESCLIGGFLTPYGQAQAVEPTETRLSFDDAALYVTARCQTSNMQRVRQTAERPDTPGRDGFGADSIEFQIDVQHSRRYYRHIIVPPNGCPVTLHGFNNRQEQGWHPVVDCRVAMEPDAWLVMLRLPFDILGQTPQPGEVWGFNILRANPSEPSGYTQWAPTLGDALRPELFGEIVFEGTAGSHTADIETWRQYADNRRTWFLQTINGLTATDALKALPVKTWSTWNAFLAKRATPLPLRWDGVATGVDGIPESDRADTLAAADTLVKQIAGWLADPPEHAAFAIEPLEALGDAYLLTGDQGYVTAFERAIDIHGRRMDDITASITDPHQLPYGVNPYHDSQITRTEMMAYVYLSMRAANLSRRTHEVMMTMVLRGGRFAAYNIRTAYTYGNHQIYESGVLAAVAALFPEIDGSDDWAAVAGRSIRFHLEHEVYPDGGYRERCGYHSVALSFAMQGVATIRLNGQDQRFPDLMASETLEIMERMHEWILHMIAPDGSMPAFGDYGAGSQLRVMQRGALVFNRPDFAWPLQQLAPTMVPSGLAARRPDFLSTPLPSQFTVFRDGWTPDSFYMAVDHGPLGGQHSHVDTLGFVAYAHGRPIALDTGIGTSYNDPRYGNWYRTPRAHNIIVIDDREPEKVAERIAWRNENGAETVIMRSHAYAQALQIIQYRTIVFAGHIGWLIHDRLTAPASVNLAKRSIDWILHTPFDLEPETDGLLHAGDATGGLIVLAAHPQRMAEPVLERHPASMPQPEARMMRLWDATRRLPPERLVADIPSLTWRHRPVKGNTADIIIALLPYRGPRPRASLISDGAGHWRIFRNDRPVLRHLVT